MSSDPLVRALRTWHGSGADFDEFDDSKIGTGEGHQAYGVGHYSAERKGIGESYMEDAIGRFSNKPLTYKGVPVAELSKYLQSIQGGAVGAVANAVRSARYAKYRRNRSEGARTLSEGARALDDFWDREIQEARERLKQQGEEIDNLYPRAAQALGGYKELTKHGFNSLEPIAKFFVFAHWNSNHRDILKKAEDEALRNATHSYKSFDEARQQNQLKHHGLMTRKDVVEHMNQREEAFNKIKNEFRPTMEIESYGGPITYKPRLYELNLHADPQKMLLWDKSLGDHPDNVVEAIVKAFPRSLDVSQDLTDLPGSEIYRLGTNEHKSKAAASKALMDAGIHGIKYLDGSSRNKNPTVNIYYKNQRLMDHALTGNGLSKDLHYAFSQAESTARHFHDNDLESVIRRYEHAEKSIPEVAQIRALLRQHEKDLRLDYDEKDIPRYNYVIFDPKMIRIVKKYDKDGNLVQDNSVHLKSVDHDLFKKE